MAEHPCCAKCVAITGTREGLRALSEGDGYRHYEGWQEMRRAGREGCGICRAVVKRVDGHFGGFLGGVGEEKRGESGESDADGVKVRIVVRPEWEGEEEEKRKKKKKEKTEEKKGMSGDVGSGSAEVSGSEVVGEEEGQGKRLFSGRLLKRLVFCLEREGEEGIEVAFDVETVFGDPASEFVSGKAEFKEFTDEVSLNLRKSLIDCLVDHTIDDCPGKKTGQLPRRILDVGPVKGEFVDEEAPVRLKESKEGENAIYTTLSYCWGDPKFQLITTKANLEEHLRGWPNADSLPKTFQDAVKVTRHLGIQYLWIDALCIIQDDEVDKLEQIEAMSEIYRNCIATIAASSARGVSDGFLQSGKPLKPAGQLPFLIDERGNTNDDIESRNTGTIYLRGTWVTITTSSEPLYSRAWTFQEAVLSPRVFDFNTYNSVYMCSQEDYPSLFSGHKVTGYHWPGEDIFRGVHRLEATWLFQAMYFAHPRYFFRRGEFDRNQWGMWRDVVSEYSARKRSFETDRLPALAGIARRLTPFAGEYRAGLWVESMVWHLGWEHKFMTSWPQGEFEIDDEDEEEVPVSNTTTTSDGNELAQTPRPPAPSWSWISVPHGVFIAPLHSPDPTFVSCTVEHVSLASPYGQVSSGTLTLNARLIEFSDLPFTPVFHHEATRAAFEADRAVRLDFKEDMPTSATDLNDAIGVGGTMRLLYLGSRSHYVTNTITELAKKPDARSFLVVRRVGRDMRRGTYRRVGMLHLRETEEMVASNTLEKLLEREREVVEII